ncbi:tyrosine-type recombinase/integrase [Mesorhizobium cantuariense]|uniref:Tyrosine-type recombinase/integrase n=1 Tax=Mesorhizobium cantuariense TaxID=1300275 RepID=A0ABV7MW55_9HYPH
MSSVIVEHWQERKSKKLGTSSYRYRRVVKPELRSTLGKGEITIALGSVKGEALAKYRQVHREVEQTLAAAWDELRGINRPMTARELFHETVQRIKALGLNPYRQPTDEDGGEGDDQETRDWIERSAVVDGIAAKYPTDPETDHPIGVSPEDTRLVRMLNTASPKTPAPTIEDAAKLYLKDRFALNEPGPLAKKKDEQRVARAVASIVKALERVPTVASIRREDARKVQGFIRGEVKGKGTVDRYLNDIRAIITHAIQEFDELHGLTNHFTGLPDLAGGRNGGVLPQEERRALTVTELQKMRERIDTKARLPEVTLIWRILEGTGCRLSEVTGLRVEDAVTTGDMPYIDVAWHDERRLKNVMSRRRVPLLGDALVATQAAVKLAGKSLMLFPRFGREGGGTAASAMLMKHVRAITDDPKAVVHSLRRNMKERLMRAGVDKGHQNLILGHTLEGEGERYGGPEARLDVATLAMRKAVLEET